MPTTVNSNPPLNTLPLDNETWDLVLDAQGNLSVAAPPYATAQDIASQLRAWLGECYYDKTQGLDLKKILGSAQPLGAINAMVAATAMQVPGLASVTPNLSIQSNGELTGSVGFVLTDGTSGEAVL